MPRKLVYLFSLYCQKNSHITDCLFLIYYHSLSFIAVLNITLIVYEMSIINDIKLNPVEFQTNFIKESIKN